jgi:hypothetical protein
MHVIYIFSVYDLLTVSLKVFEYAGEELNMATEGKFD